MIRKSGIVAIAAIVLSLILHVLGLGLTRTDVQTDNGAAPPAPDVTDTGAPFEDFAEPTPPAEQPEVTPPDELLEDATSEALVASDNPQDTLVPDAAAASDSEPESETPAQAESASEADEAETAAGEDEENIGELAALEPQDNINTPDVTQAETPTEEPTETLAPEPVEVTPTETEETPTEPDVTESLEADVVVVETPEEPDILAAEDSDDLSQSAVTRSLRPPAERPTTEELGATAYVQQQQQQQRQARVIESPLDVYRRTGVDQLGLGRLGTSQSTSFAGSGGAGNATTTNYVGRVLVQLNRLPVGNVSDSGSARVQFQINPDGSLAWVRIVRSSGKPSVDRAATTQVRRASPFPRPPSGTSQRLVFVYRNR